MKALIVDDSVAAREDLRVVLEELDLEVVLAATAPDGIKAFHADSEIQLVIVDWELPVISGPGVIGHLRNVERFAFILMVTGRSNDKDESQALSCGADDFISKPYSRKDLQLRVQVGQRLIAAHNRVVRESGIMAAILGSINEGMIACDAQGNILHVNQNAVEILGPEISSTPLHEWPRKWKFLRPDRKTPFPDEDLPLARALAGHATELCKLCVHTVGDDSSGTLVEASAAPVRIEGKSELDGAVVVFREIERRIALEQKLAHAQQLESVGSLAAGVAHEINTPAQYVGDNLEFLTQSFDELGELLKGYQSLLAAAEAGPVSSALIAETRQLETATDIAFLEEEIPRALAQSRDGIGRVSSIVRAMKEFSHPGSREKQPVDLNRIIESTVTVASNEWKYVADLTMDFDPDLPRILGLQGELNQVVLNIIVNAAHAVGDAAAAGREKGQIVIRTRRDDEDWALLVIEDTGAGMPDEVRRRIFDPFFTTKDVGRGTGQGLSIAHTVVVEKHRGTIEVESVVGRGTKFMIRLPLAKAAVTA